MSPGGKVSVLAANGRISREALIVTGGLLLIGSLRILSSVLAPHEPAPPAERTSTCWAA